jgi:hypothetical protein
VAIHIYNFHISVTGGVWIKGFLQYYPLITHIALKKYINKIMYAPQVPKPPDGRYVPTVCKVVVYTQTSFIWVCGGSK